jgi:hypothetical protein
VRRLRAQIVCAECVRGLRAQIACADCVRRLRARIACADCVQEADVYHSPSCAARGVLRAGGPACVGARCVPSSLPSVRAQLLLPFILLPPLFFLIAPLRSNRAHVAWLVRSLTHSQVPRNPRGEPGVVLRRLLNPRVLALQGQSRVQPHRFVSAVTLLAASQRADTTRTTTTTNNNTSTITIWNHSSFSHAQSSYTCLGASDSLTLL